VGNLHVTELLALGGFQMVDHLESISSLDHYTQYKDLNLIWRIRFLRPRQEKHINFPHLYPWDFVMLPTQHKTV
jgi:hypothetical protein